MSRGLFVTGTDTGVGKTIISRGLITALKKSGLRVGAMKPIETGGGSDGESLLAATGLPWSIDQVRPIALELPAAPEVAAQHQHRTIDLDALERNFRERAADCDFIVVEGAGGLMVPIAPRFTMAELAKRFELPLLIVARSALGTINHTLLTVEAARNRQLPIAGIVLSQTARERGGEEDATAAIIERHSGVPIFARIPFLDDVSPEKAATFFDQALESLR